MRHALRLLTLLPLAACNVAGDPISEPDVSAQRGALLFAQDCAACHGEAAGGGVGPDLTGISARHGGAFPWDRVLSQIDGYGLHGAVMPEFGAGDMGPTVVVERDGLGTPVPADLLALATFLEGVQREGR